MLSDLIFRFRSLFRRRAVENELDDELRFHVEQQVEKHVRSGLTREEALRQTRLEFGGLDHVKEDCRESHGITFLETTVRDIRYALRQLRRTPAFTITVLLTLALGIGANAAIFTLVNAVLLKKLPVTDPAALVRLGDNNDCCVGSGNRQDGDFAMFSTDTYEQLKKMCRNSKSWRRCRPVSGAGLLLRGVTERRRPHVQWQRSLSPATTSVRLDSSCGQAAC
jgi:macrolide transport system ATP-binding/permease protein